MTDRHVSRQPGRRPRGKQRRERDCASAAEQPSVALPGDTVISRRISRHENADFLQRSCEHAVSKMAELGHEPLFGISGWIVAAPAEPLPPGFARVSTIAAEGFHVVPTPHLGSKEHVTILLSDPVDDEQAARFSVAFGAAP